MFKIADITYRKTSHIRPEIVVKYQGKTSPAKQPQKPVEKPKQASPPPGRTT